MKLYKRGKVWYADLRSIGQGQRSTGLRDKKAAEATIYKYLASQGVNPDPHEPITLEHLIIQYLEFAKLHKTPSSYDSDRTLLGNLLNHIGNKQVADITPHDIQGWRVKTKKVLKQDHVPLIFGITLKTDGMG